MALLTTRYDAWLTAVLETGASLPSESKATCSNCAMCSDGAGTSPNGSSSESFSTDVKCCTYWPTLANFLLGGILRSSEPDEGRARVEDLLRSRPAMFTPFGAAPPLEYERVYAAVHSSRFGRAPELKCPFHDSAQAASCTIWHHRNAVCASWFCKHDRGEMGALFWREVKALFAYVERSVAIWCATELGCSDECLRLVSANRTVFSRSRNDVQADAASDAQRSVSLWGDWRGREVEFYTHAAQLVDQLSWADVVALSGAEGRALALSVQRAYQRLTTDTIPERLSVGTFRVQWIDADGLAVSTYSRYDPVKLSKPLVSVLHTFDGSPTTDTLVRMRKAGIEIEPQLIRTLVDFNVLVPTSEPARPRLEPHD